MSPEKNLYTYVSSNPQNYSDPWGLWTTGKGLGLFGKPEHENMTKEAAKEEGYSGSDKAADEMAKANKCVDPGFFIGELYKHYQTAEASKRAEAEAKAKAWIANKQNDAINKAISCDVKGALKAIGEALHTIQDKWSHGMETSEREPGLFGGAKIMPGTPEEHDPKRDKRSTNPHQWNMAKLDTKLKLQALEKEIRERLKKAGECKAQQDWVIYKLKNYCKPNLMDKEKFKNTYVSPPKKQQKISQAYPGFIH